MTLPMKASFSPPPVSTGPATTFVPASTVLSSLVGEGAKLPEGVTRERVRTVVRLEFKVTDEAFNGWSRTEEVFLEMKKADKSLTITPNTPGNPKLQSFKSAIAKTKAGWDTYFKYELRKMPNTPRKHAVYVTIETAVSLEYLRKEMFEWLRKMNVWMYKHNWNTTKITSIGILVKIHPDLTWRSDVQNTLSANVAATIAMQGGKTAPQVQLVTNIVSSGRKDDDTRISTKVLEVQCEEIHSHELKTLMCSSDFAETSSLIFVPHGYGQVTSWQDYRNILHSHKAHTEAMVGIPFVGILPSTMDRKGRTPAEGTFRMFFWKFINGNDPIFISLERTGDTDIKGRWRLLCHRDHLEEARHRLDHFFLEEYPKIATECDKPTDIPNPYRTDGPRITTHFQSHAQRLMSTFSNPQNGELEEIIVRKPPTPNAWNNKRPYASAFFDGADTPTIVTASLPASTIQGTPQKKEADNESQVQVQIREMFEWMKMDSHKKSDQLQAMDTRVNDHATQLASIPALIQTEIAKALALRPAPKTLVTQNNYQATPPPSEASSSGMA